MPTDITQVGATAKLKKNCRTMGRYPYTKA